MDSLKKFKEVILENQAIALATSVDSTPNVRIVNYITHDEEPGVLYFATFKGNQKEKEFKINSSISFTTIPEGDAPHIKVRGGRVIPSSKTIDDVKDKFIKKIPGYREVIEKAADFLNLYELHFTKAILTLDFENIIPVEIKRA